MKTLKYSDYNNINENIFVAAAATATAINVVKNILKRRLAINRLLADEDDPAKKERLKKELSKMKTRELTALNDYKKKEQIYGKLKKTSDPEDKNNPRVQNVENRIKDTKEEIQDLKNDDSEDA